jgi:uncharacterized protein (TIGR03435 family)
MGRVLTAGVLILAAVAVRVPGLHGQAAQPDQKAPAFEVASVKLHTTSGLNERSGIDETAGSIRVENLPLKGLIEAAYDVRDYQFTGPSWLNTVRYDVVAKPPAGFTQPQLRPLLQSLLTDRFKLTAHHESKEMGVYELVVAKSGSKLHESTGPRTFFTARPALISGTRVSMRELAGALSGLLDRPVTDYTGLLSVYDVKVQWTPDQLRDFKASADLPPGTLPRINGAPFDPDGPSVFTAVQEQLGLKLESTKGPVDVLVIDHVEKPTED